MTFTNAAADEQAVFWNERGGRGWVQHIERLENWSAALNRRLFDAVAIRPGERVLDIGCGGGLTSAEYARSAGVSGAVLGVDISETILRVPRERYAKTPSLKFLCADAGTHDFSNEAFDVVASRFGVMFFSDPVKAFANIRSGVASGARLRFLCWRSIKENPWMGAPALAAFSVLPTPEKLPPGAPGPFAFADPDHIETVLHCAGFQSVTCEPVDELLALGGVENALELLTHVGAASRPLAEASPKDREAAREAMRLVLMENDTAEGVFMAGATWLVSGEAA